MNRGEKRTSGIECGSGFQPRQLTSRLEAAPTEGLSNGSRVSGPRLLSYSQQPVTRGQKPINNSTELKDASLRNSFAGQDTRGLGRQPPYRWMIFVFVNQILEELGHPARIKDHDQNQDEAVNQQVDSG